MNTSNIKIRKAKPEDIKQIISLSAQLDEYGQQINQTPKTEKPSKEFAPTLPLAFADTFALTEEAFKKYCFCTNPLFYSLVAEIIELDYSKSLENLEDKENKDKLVASVIYFFSFSTFTGKPTLYIEDIFVLAEHRGKGIGKQLFSELLLVAKEKNCARIEWAVLNQNASSIKFYKSLGAFPLDERTSYRLDL